MLVVSAAVDVKYLAKKIKPMLEAKDMKAVNLCLSVE